MDKWYRKYFGKLFTFLLLLCFVSAVFNKFDVKKNKDILCLLNLTMLMV